MKRIQFSHIEKSGIILLFAILLGSILIIEIKTRQAEQVPLIKRDTGFDSSDDAIPQKTKQIKRNDVKKFNHLNKKKKSGLFSFDPNNVSYDSLVLLGLSKKTAQNWTRYLAKGGKFKSKGDLKKIYGVSGDWFDEVEPYIRIEEQKLTVRNVSEKAIFIDNNRKEPVGYHAGPVKNLTIRLDINEASQEDFMQLRGIGQTLSKRIIKYRESLGGFYAVSQIGEVYGLQDSLYQILKSQLFVDEVKLELIPVNTLTVNELARHPYIDLNLAKKIERYRVQHQGIHNPESLKKIYMIDRSMIDKLLPYLDFSKP